MMPTTRTAAALYPNAPIYFTLLLTGSNGGTHSVRPSSRKMLYIVRFTDKPDSLALRKEFLAAHIAWLDQHKDTILVAGSLRPDQGQDAVGGLWIVEAPGKADIERLLQSDPFWVQGLRQSCEILYWSKAFPERKVTV